MKFVYGIYNKIRIGVAILVAAEFKIKNHKD
jgi:hypothetical protein